MITYKRFRKLLRVISRVGGKVVLRRVACALISPNPVLDNSAGPTIRELSRGGSNPTWWRELLFESGWPKPHTYRTGLGSAWYSPKSFIKGDDRHVDVAFAFGNSVLRLELSALGV